MKYFYLIFVPYFVFATNDMFCLVCHEGGMSGLSTLVPRKEWKKLTSDGGKRLQQIHKNNLDVQTYFKGNAYDENALFRAVKYSSESERMYAARKFARECFICHKNERHLAYFYTRSEWEHLKNPFNKLIEKHKYQIKVVKQLQSKAFKNVLPEFRKYISVYAPSDSEDIRKDTYMIPILKKVSSENNNEKSYFVYKFDTKSLHFTYKTEKGTKQNAKDIYSYVMTNLKKHTFQEPLSIRITESDWETDPGNAFMFIMTFGLASVTYTKDIHLLVTSGDTLYKSEKVLKKIAGGTIQGMNGLGMIKVVEVLFDDLNMSTNSHNE